MGKIYTNSRLHGGIHGKYVHIINIYRDVMWEQSRTSYNVFFFLYFSAAMIISRLNGVPFLLTKIFLKPNQRNKYEYYVHTHTCVYANIIFKRLSFPFILCAVRYHYEHSAHDRLTIIVYNIIVVGALYKNN